MGAVRNVLATPAWQMAHVTGAGSFCFCWAEMPDGAKSTQGNTPTATRATVLNRGQKLVGEVAADFALTSFFLSVTCP